MDFARNLPFLSIMLLMFLGIVMPVLGPRASRIISMASIGITAVISAWLVAYTYNLGASFTYMMGHFPAPFGNELRAGVLEAIMALSLCSVAFLSLLGNDASIDADIPNSKKNLYYIMINLLMASLLALVYTNDIFTAYVFVEINTIAACAIVMSKPGGETIVATIRYLIMSLLGSGLFLIAISLIYDLTGHLLMSNMQESITVLMETGEYVLPLVVIIGLFGISMAIKSALFPFHSWLPDAHGSATTASSAILSGLVLKGYIILLIKLFYRVFTLDVVNNLHITDTLFVLGLLGMIMGSVQAIREKNIKRMIAYSSVSQIGYIFIGIGIATTPGMVAACFHILAHMITKPMLFIAAGSLIDMSGHKKEFHYLRGSAWHAPFAGVAFLCGALSMIGIPFFSGFISKFRFATATFDNPTLLVPTLLVLALSTVLNAIYYLPAVTCIFARHVEPDSDSHGAGAAQAVALPLNENTTATAVKMTLGCKVVLITLIALNFALGVFSQPLLTLIEHGLKVFG